jgi:hypothetical protein
MTGNNAPSILREVLKAIVKLEDGGTSEQAPTKQF